MENYTVRFNVSLELNVMADNPDEAYNAAHETAMTCLNVAYNNVSIMNGSVFDESGNRVD